MNACPITEIVTDLNIFKTSWFRAASHKKFRTRCRKRIPPSVLVLIGKVRIFKFFQNYNFPGRSTLPKKIFWGYPLMPNLVEIHLVVWPPNPNKQTDRQIPLFYIYELSQPSQGPFWAPKLGTTSAFPKTVVKDLKRVKSGNKKFWPGFISYCSSIWHSIFSPF